MPTRTTLAIFTLLLAFSLAEAEMYQWEDENGVVILKDTPPPVSKKRNKVKVYNDSDFDAAPLQQPLPAKRSNKNSASAASQQAAPVSERFNGTVEIYVTDWCGYCKQALTYMKSNGINYKAYDIEKDNAASKRHKELGGRGVPLLVIGSNKMSGFSPETLEYYLNNSR